MIPSICISASADAVLGHVVIPNDDTGIPDKVLYQQLLNGEKCRINFKKGSNYASFYSLFLQKF